MVEVWLVLGPEHTVERLIIIWVQSFFVTLGFLCCVSVQVSCCSVHQNSNLTSPLATVIKQRCS